MFLIATLSLWYSSLSGFVGKVLIIEEGLAKGGTNASFYWLAALGLFSSFLVLYSLLKIFINGFGETLLSEDMEKGSTKGLLLPCALLVAIGIFLGVGAEWLSYIEQAWLPVY